MLDEVVGVSDIARNTLLASITQRREVLTVTILLNYITKTRSYNSTVHIVEDRIGLNFGNNITKSTINKRTGNSLFPVLLFIVDLLINK